jgi:hypothetical protein
VNDTSDSASGAVGMAAGIASARERNERFLERCGADGGGHDVGKRKKRAIARAALWGWRRACRRQERETSDSATGAVVMAAGMSSARERNERFGQLRTGDGGGHVLGKRSKRAIPRAALWGWRRALHPQEKETGDSASGAVGMAAGIASARERNERFCERRCGDGGGHCIGKRKKRAILPAALR